MNFWVKIQIPFAWFEKIWWLRQESWFRIGESICTRVTIPPVTLCFSSASGLKARFNQNYCNISDLFDHCVSKHSLTNNGSSFISAVLVLCVLQVNLVPDLVELSLVAVQGLCTNCWVTQSIICQFLCYLQFCVCVFVWECTYEWSCLLFLISFRHLFDTMKKFCNFFFFFLRGDCSVNYISFYPTIKPIKQVKYEFRIACCVLLWFAIGWLIEVRTKIYGRFVTLKVSCLDKLNYLIP